MSQLKIEMCSVLFFVKLINIYFFPHFKGGSTTNEKNQHGWCCKISKRHFGSYKWWNPGAATDTPNRFGEYGRRHKWFRQRKYKPKNLQITKIQEDFRRLLIWWNIYSLKMFLGCDLQKNKILYYKLAFLVMKKN